MKRRQFLQNTALLSLGATTSGFRRIAGPFAPTDLYQIPIDKKLDPEWVKSLYRRGFTTTYSSKRNELDYIGMPVGGLFAGMVYLGGDGRLWLWDVFNKNQLGVDNKTIDWPTPLHVGKKVRPVDGSAYVEPYKDVRPLDQGFAFLIKRKGKTWIKKMVAADWDEIRFEATYPMATVHYIDQQLQLHLKAKIYSPFIPLHTEDSSFPATIYSFEVENNNEQPLEITIMGWLENKTARFTITDKDKRKSASFISKKHKGVLLSSLPGEASKLAEQHDFGTMAIACISPKALVNTNYSGNVELKDFSESSELEVLTSKDNRSICSVADTLRLKSKGKSKLDFVYSWHSPNLQLNPVIQGKGRYYTNFFSDAKAVVEKISSDFNRLSSLSKKWMETWYDSSLPHWFMERTFLNISTLATTTVHRFTSGRFYAWEGVGCCEGTCMHVWQYAHAMGRIFPDVERDTRERVDLGLSLQPDGMMWYRGEVVKTPAIDGQAGTILRIYREHQMSASDAFLKKNWEKIKKATEYVIRQDKNGDGMEDTPIENTLDAVWDGEIAWLVGLCIAAVKAGAAMAAEMGDVEFANVCKRYVEKGARNMEEQLFNGEYFIHKPDAVKGREKLGSYNTSHIDQVYGQSWAHQVALGRIVSLSKSQSALKALWKYNFTPDVGPYIKDHLGGRPYAMAGDGGMIMNTNPKNEEKPYGEKVTWQLGYFHECMSGFEHQVAAHMMAEGMVEEALVLTRVIHDRYHAAKRNPFNEIECSDHYARAMASHGTFLMACGFEYHGPLGTLSFDPKLGADQFHAPFVTAEGWGKFSQSRTETSMQASVKLNHGKLVLHKLGLHPKHAVKGIKVQLNGKLLKADLVMENCRQWIGFADKITLMENDLLTINI